MVDILKDVQGELHATAISLTNRVEIPQIDHDNKKGLEEPGQSTASDVRDLSRGSDHIAGSDSHERSLGSYEEVESSFAALRLDPDSSTDVIECRACGSRRHTEISCPSAPSQEASEDYEAPQASRRGPTRIDFGGPTYSVTTAQGYGEGKRKWTIPNLVWHCSECGDGPYGDWQVSCQHCQHKKCSGCFMTEVEGAF